jgi:hyperosmotically inducible protein
MGLLFRLLLLVVLVVGLVWLFRDPIADRLGQRARAQGEQAGERARGAGERLGLDVDRITEELKQTGRVVRSKASAAARDVADATRDPRTSARIKARLALDPELSALQIGVNTTDGRVTLSGRVDSAEEVARAIELAMQEDEVREVISTLQIQRRSAGDQADAPTPAPTATPQE